MASINFYLGIKKGQETHFLYMYVRYGRNTFKYNTREKLEVKQWNPERQKVKPSVTGAAEINSYLESLEKKIDGIFREYKTQGIIPSVDLLKERMQLKVIEPQDKVTFFSLFEKFLSVSSNSKTYNTVRNYKSLLNHLKNFNETYKYNLDFDKINFSFYHDLVEYCVEDCSMASNTIASVIKNLKVFLKHAEEVGVKVNQDYLKFKVSYKNPERIFLTWEEVKILQKLDLSDRKSWEQVRDVYLFGCYTGLRFSDIEKLKPENVYEFNEGKLKTTVIRIIQKKTKDYLEIALNDYAKEIINKYKGKFTTCLPVISNQKTNDHLKDIGSFAEINSPVTKVEYKGGKRVDTVVPKYTLLTMHTARHTFATLSLQRQMPVEVLQKILGHRKINNTMIYAKIVDSHKHTEMLNVWKKDKNIKGR